MTIYTAIIGACAHFVRSPNATIAARTLGVKRVATLADGWIPTTDGIARTYDAWANQPDTQARREHYSSKAAPTKSESFDNAALLRLIG